MRNKFYAMYLEGLYFETKTQEEENVITEYIEKFLKENENNTNVLHNKDTGMVYTRNISNILGGERTEESFYDQIRNFDGGDYFELSKFREIPKSACIIKLIDKLKADDEYIASKLNSAFDNRECLDIVISKLIDEQLIEVIDEHIESLREIQKDIKVNGFKWR